MQSPSINPSFFGTEEIWRIVLRLAPPVVLSELILSLYNICDSGFVGHNSSAGLAALSVIFPIQFLIISLASGFGIGLNTLMAKLYAQRRFTSAHYAAGSGSVLAVLLWLLFAIGVFFLLGPYVKLATSSEETAQASLSYGRIVCYGSLPHFLDCVWCRIHQACGNMRRTMFAQTTGALVNILLDWLLIFGVGPFPKLGIAGAAWATIIGQLAAALITFHGGYHHLTHFRTVPRHIKDIFLYGYSQVLRLFTMTFYIVLLNMILARFSDSAVTVLGLYYKVQIFFLIPLTALNTCAIPVISYNFTRKAYQRCREIMRLTIRISILVMAIGTICFEFFPRQLFAIFTRDDSVLVLGIPAFRIIGLSLIPLIYSLIFPVFFQAVGDSARSVFLSLLRQIFTLLPLFWLFSLMGVGYTWLAFPAAETITGLTGIYCYRKLTKTWNRQ